MLADLTVEHQTRVRQTDIAHPDLADLPLLLHRFASLIGALFFEGHVVKMEHLVISQIPRFLQGLSALLVDEFPILGSRPDRTQGYVIFEPLQRIRLV